MAPDNCPPGGQTSGPMKRVVRLLINRDIIADKTPGA